MAEEKDDSANKELGVEVGAGGVKVNAKGYHLGNVLQMCLVLILAAIAYMTYEVKTDTRAATVALSSATIKSAESVATQSKVEHDKLGAAIDRNTDAQGETSYILTLNQQQRERLNVRMPDSLRRKVDRDR